jgi:predicted dehydrogenase
MKPLKIGVIGANWTGTFHTPAWRLLPGVEVDAICTTSEQTARAAAARLGIARPFWSVEEMLADPALDIIDVGTQPATRVDFVLAALEAGKHVYNCIPFALTEEQGFRQRDLARAKNRVGVVDAQWRWTPAIRRLGEIVREGGLGEFFTASLHLYLPLWEHDGLRYTECVWSDVNAPYRWLADRRSGASAWHNFGTHALLNLMFLFGEIEEVIGLTETFVDELVLPDGSTLRPDTADFGQALVRFRNGGVANINVSWAMPDAPGYRLEVCGSRARALAEDNGFCDTTTKLYVGSTARPAQRGARNGAIVDLPARLFEIEGTQFSKDNSPQFLVPLTALFADMVRCIRNGESKGSPSFAEAAHAHSAMLAVVRSMESRRWEKVRDA